MGEQLVDPNHGLVSADPVHETAIPRAHPLLDSTTEEKESVANWIRSCLPGVMVCSLLRALIIWVLYPNAASHNVSSEFTEGPSSNHSMSESLFQQDLQQHMIVGMLESNTLQSLKDPTSPQSMALQWLLNDPELQCYLEQAWRIRQRFALATLFYSTGGPTNWRYKEQWMNYSVHECSWFARPHFAYHIPFVKTPA